MLPRTAAQVLMPPDGAFKTHTSLRETLNQADLDLPYFRTTEQNSPGLMQFANHKTAISPFAGELIAQQTSIWRTVHIYFLRKNRCTYIQLDDSTSIFICQLYF